jgi:ABC-type multidrug transport system fused ATPase/permease subunit
MKVQTIKLQFVGGKIVNKKMKTFYIVDLIVMFISFVGMIVVNNKANFGLAALTSVGYFVILLSVFSVSIILLIILPLIYVILKKKQRQISK